MELTVDDQCPEIVAITSQRSRQRFQHTTHPSRLHNETCSSVYAIFALRQLCHCRLEARNQQAKVKSTQVEQGTHQYATDRTGFCLPDGRKGMTVSHCQTLEGFSHLVVGLVRRKSPGTPSG
jgi:hypothetical protein